MSKHKLSLSIVIPVYNEQDHIGPCLQAIAAQSVMPNEVIVVDNNCTDDTVKIAREFPFVRVVKESKQGRGYARTKGFNAAKSDVIGRIDADSVIMPGWVSRVLNAFKDGSIMGLTGIGETWTIPSRVGPNFYSTFWSRGYFWSTYADIRLQTMWGANMAIRKSAWRVISPQACLDDELVHEDIDMSLLMQAAHLKIVKDTRLRVKTKGISYHYLPKMVHYFLLRFSTLKFRKPLLRSAQPPVGRLGFWGTQYYRAISFIPFLVFILTSLLWWPVDVYFVKIRKRRRWLE